jgi:regulator of sigma E protease
VFFWAIGPQDTTRVVDQVDKKFPAAGVLKPGDRLVAVDGHRGDPGQLSDRVNSHKCAGPEDQWRNGCRAVEPAKLTIVRNGERRTVTITPRYDFPPGAEGGRMRVGFAYRAGPHEPLPVGTAFTTTADRFWFITKQTLSLPARLINPEQRKQISGVVGSYEVTRQTILKQVENVVGILAIISLSLAIVNLFPFLPLDGGHIFWAIVEKVRGRPVSLRVMERSGVVGFMLVILIFLIGLSNDIGRLSGEGFQVP